MGKGKYTPFGLEVKTRLLAMGLEQRELAKAVSEDTGMFVDSAYISKIITGERSPEKVIASIKKILDIEDTTASE